MRVSGKILFLAGVTAVAGAGFALRLLALPPLLPDLDSVNFARSLSTFDLAAQSPHFPGYPVYVLLARGAAALGFPEVAALAIPGILLAPLAVVLLCLALRERVGGAGAIAAGAVLSLAPLAVLFGGAPSSDGAGFAGLVMAVALALGASRAKEAERRGGWRPGPLVAGLVAGLALGARPSYLPALVLLPLIFDRAAALRWIGGAAAGVFAWLLPVVLLTGPAAFVQIASGFLAGHAGEWGGTVVVRPELGERFSLFAFDLGAAGLGLPWVGAFGASRMALALLLIGCVLVLVRAWRGRAISADGAGLLLRTALLVGAPYAAWAFLGQNLLKARHAIPLLLPASLLVGAAVASLALPPLRRAYAAATACAFVTVALPIAAAQGREASPAARLVQRVAATLPAEGLQIFTGEEARLFERYAPQYRAGRVADGEELVRSAATLARAGVDVYVTSAAPGFERLRPGLQPVAELRADRLVRSHSNRLVLFRYRPSLAAIPGDK